MVTSPMLLFIEKGHLFGDISGVTIYRSLSLCQQEDINITQESGRSHIMGQTLKEKKGLLRAWILRDIRPGVSGVCEGGDK